MVVTCFNDIFLREKFETLVSHVIEPTDFTNAIPKSLKIT
jgi:hypothetical protein